VTRAHAPRPPNLVPAAQLLVFVRAHESTKFSVTTDMLGGVVHIKLLHMLPQGIEVQDLCLGELSTTEALPVIDVGKDWSTRLADGATLPIDNPQFPGGRLEKSYDAARGWWTLGLPLAEPQPGFATGASCFF
jgi:hypothetical protein